MEKQNWNEGVQTSGIPYQPSWGNGLESSEFSSKDLDTTVSRPSVLWLFMCCPGIWETQIQIPPLPWSLLYDLGPVRPSPPTLTTSQVCWGDKTEETTVHDPAAFVWEEKIVLCYGTVRCSSTSLSIFKKWLCLLVVRAFEAKTASIIALHEAQQFPHQPFVNLFAQNPGCSDRPQPVGTDPPVRGTATVLRSCPHPSCLQWPTSGRLCSQQGDD